MASAPAVGRSIVSRLVMLVLRLRVERAFPLAVADCARASREHGTHTARARAPMRPPLRGVICRLRERGDVARRCVTRTQSFDISTPVVLDVGIDRYLSAGLGS